MIDKVSLSLTEPLCEMMLVIAERFSSVLSVIHYVCNCIEDPWYEENVKNVVDRYVGRYLVQVLSKEEGEIRLLICEGLNRYVRDDGDNAKHI